MLSSLLERKRVAILLVVVLILTTLGIFGYYFLNQTTNEPSSSATSIPITTQIGTAEQAITVSAVSEIPDITIHSFNTDLLLSFLEMIEYGPETGVHLWGKRGVFQGHNIHIVFTDIKNKPKDDLLYLEVVDLQGDSISGTQSSYNPDTKTITYTLYNKVFPQATAQEIARTWSYQVMQMFYFFKNTTAVTSDKKAFESQLGELMPRDGEQLFVITKNASQQTTIPNGDSLLEKAAQFLTPAQVYAQNCNGYFECGRDSWRSTCGNGSACDDGFCAIQEPGSTTCENEYVCAPAGHQSCNELLSCTGVGSYCNSVPGACVGGNIDNCGFSNPPPTTTPTPTPEPGYAWCGDCGQNTCGYRTHDECNSSGYGLGGCTNCGTPPPTTPPPTTPPTPSCTVSLDYLNINRGVGEAPLTITALPSNVQNGTISSIGFTTTNSGIATVSPNTDATNPYQTNLSPVAIGSTTLTASVYMGGATPVCTVSSPVTIRASQCNDTCVANSGCPSGLSCKTTYSFPATFTDVTSWVSNVGNTNLPILGFHSYNTGSTISQYILRGGSVWSRTSSMSGGSAVWGNWASVTDVPAGSGPITSYTASFSQNYGLLTRYAVRDGILYTRNYITGWVPQNSVIGAVPPTPATLLAYSVHYNAAQNHTTTYAITEDNEYNTIWVKTSTEGNFWRDSTQSLLGITGTAPNQQNKFTSASLFDYPTGYGQPAGTLGHYFVRGERVLHRTALQNSDMRCRLDARPNATSCQIPTQLSCGASICNASTICEPNLRCALTGNGNRYCTVPEYEASCSGNPNFANCCQAPPCNMSCTQSCGGVNWDTTPATPTGLSVLNRNTTTGDYNVQESGITIELSWDPTTVPSPGTHGGYDIWVMPQSDPNPSNGALNTTCTNTGSNYCRVYTTNSATAELDFNIQSRQTNQLKIFVRTKNACGAAGSWSAALPVNLTASVTGTVYDVTANPAARTTTGINNCAAPDLAGGDDPIDISGTGSTITTVVNGITRSATLEPDGTYSVTVPYSPGGAWVSSWGGSAQLNIGSGFAGGESFVCRCPDDSGTTTCTNTDTLTPTTPTNSENFFISSLDTSNTPWWQTNQGHVFAQDGLTSNIPTSCDDDASCNPYFITANSSSNWRSAGIPMTSSANIQLNGFFTQFNPPIQPRTTEVDFSKVERETYDFFAKKVSLSSLQTISTSITAMPTPNAQNNGETEMYYATGDLTLNLNSAIAVAANRKIVIFVENDLIIDSNAAVGSDSPALTVGTDGFLGFIVRGDVTFMPAVGRVVTGVPFTITQPSTPVVEGVFVVDGSIIVADYGDMPTNSPALQDKKFIGAGTYVAWSGFSLNRTFENDTDPLSALINNTNAVSVFRFRPDFVRQFPEVLKTPNIVWQEVN